MAIFGNIRNNKRYPEEATVSLNNYNKQFQQSTARKEILRWKANEKIFLGRVNHETNKKYK